MGVYRRLLQLARPFYGKFAAALALAALGAGLNALSMYLVKLVTDDVLSPKRSFAEFDQVSAWLLSALGIDLSQSVPALMMVLLVIYPSMIVAIMLLKGVFNYFSEILRNHAANSIVLQARRLLFEKLTRLPLAYHSRQRIGDLTARVTNDCQLMHSGVTDVIGRIGGAGLNIFFLTGLIFFINWKFALQVLVIFPVAMGPLLYFGRKIRKYSFKGQEAMSDMNALLHETLSGIRVVFSFNMEKIEIKRFVSAAKKYFDAAMKQLRIKAAAGPVMDLIGGLGVALMIYMAGSHVVAGTMTLGDFFAMMGAISSMYPQIKNINGVNVAIQNSIAASARVFEILDTPENIREKQGAKIIAPVSSQIKFENVSFCYETDKEVLKAINLEVPAGKRLAIVGPSGAGKTTLVDLVARFHDPASGSISLDGVDLCDATLESLRGQIGLVTQETFLFNGSIASNIGYGKPGASPKEIQDAAKAANAHDFILEQAKGYDTEIGERGVRLSGGQRQRLSIARAILKNPPILILDEATSALDTQSEQLVQQALENLMSRRTTLVIAHRLSTVQGADEIVVLKDGEIEERGRHAELLAAEGLYARLYKLQFREVQAA